MNWKEELKGLEGEQKWDVAIKFMQGIIKASPEDLDAYLSINYLLMNLLVEEDHDESKHHEYEALLKYYFSISWSKFSVDSEYLFFTGITAYMSEWYFAIDIEDAKIMLQKALLSDPKNILYQWGYYSYIKMSDATHQEKSASLAEQIMANKKITQNLHSKGSLGSYILEIIAYQCGRSKKIEN